MLAIVFPGRAAAVIDEETLAEIFLSLSRDIDITWISPTKREYCDWNSVTEVCIGTRSQREF